MNNALKCTEIKTQLQVTQFQRINSINSTLGKLSKMDHVRTSSPDMRKHSQKNGDIFSNVSEVSYDLLQFFSTACCDLECFSSLFQTSTYEKTQIFLRPEALYCPKVIHSSFLPKVEQKSFHGHFMSSMIISWTEIQLKNGK